MPTRRPQQPDDVPLDREALIETDTERTPPDDDAVRERAYHLYVERGYADGRADEDWHWAERELRGD